MLLGVMGVVEGDVVVGGWVNWVGFERGYGGEDVWETLRHPDYGSLC